MRRMYITEKEYAGLKKLLELVEVLGYDAEDDVLVINKAVHLEVIPDVDADPIVLVSASDGSHTNTVICGKE